MSKRAIESDSHMNDVEMGDVSVQENVNQNDQSQAKRPFNNNAGNEEIGEFEDIWEDELESEDEIEEDDFDVEESEMNTAETSMQDEIEDQVEEEDLPEKVYLPGDQLDEGEVLQVDNSAYQMLHNLNVNWPCLSFDFFIDELGVNRNKFPHTMALFTGSQANEAHKNEVTLMKISNLHRTINDDKLAEDNEELDEDENDLDEDPILETRTMKHRGGVNRVRVTKTRDSILGATWSDEGCVFIWNLKDQLKSLEVPGFKATTKKPVYTVQSHPCEGFALDWQQDKRLISGDCDRSIYLTNVRADGGFTVEKTPFSGHKSSIEDLQWSPEEQSVFASCSSDKSIRIWDIRQKQHTCAISVPNAHRNDVNVMSWNPTSRFLLASGDDDGLFSVWDLRNFKAKPVSPVATFDWHKKPITSIEWHPQDDSVLAVSGADDQLTIWDLSVELDSEEIKAQSNMFYDAKNNIQRAVPPQLLFIHQGQSDIKEVHWNSQIPGSLVSTALNGFNIFKTISV
ncbi:Ribosome assembly protein rrb1 [Smittium culicis]|uniref:Glutamate-rich WD repeat-containing protein 1 n=1 Tax=Smittium culicis TaxID=133412 RepID=A0A1R1YBC8_9FUNG|nr:Ribosome assembly protein rrb1 [Smittium culicis]